MRPIHDNQIDEHPLYDESKLTETRQVIENEVGELIDFLQLIDTLPMQYRGEFYRALSRLVDGFERRQKVLGYIQKSLSQMSLDLKYMVFDLEATRRERDEYKRRLEELL